MLIAVFSDVHANVPALEAVLREISTYKPDLMVCLGDLVGYNAEPVGAIELVRASGSIVVAGNHDLETATSTVSPGTSLNARLSHEWTREQLKAEHFEYLLSLPNRHIESGVFIAVHGCFINDTHVNGYVTGIMLDHNLAAIANRSEWPKLAFCGHTHTPMCGWLLEDAFFEHRLKQPLELPRRYSSVIINPGSVGQPRDGNPLASFALVDTVKRTVQVVRVAYDIDRAVNAIMQAGLPLALAERLREGR